MATTTAPAGFGRPIWSAIKGGSQVHGVGLIPVNSRFLGAVTGSGPDAAYRTIFTVPPATVGLFKIEAATILAGTALAAEASNYWSFNLLVGKVTTFTSLSNLALTTTAGFAIRTAYTLPVDGPETVIPKKVFLEAGDCIRVKMLAATTSSANLSAVNFNVVLWLRHSPPGR